MADDLFKIKHWGVIMKGPRFGVQDVFRHAFPLDAIADLFGNYVDTNNEDIVELHATVLFWNPISKTEIKEAIKKSNPPIEIIEDLIPFQFYGHRSAFDFITNAFVKQMKMKNISPWDFPQTL